MIVDPEDAVWQELIPQIESKVPKRKARLEVAGGVGGKVFGMSANQPDQQLFLIALRWYWWPHSIHETMLKSPKLLRNSGLVAQNVPYVMDVLVWQQILEDLWTDYVDNWGAGEVSAEHDSNH